MKTLEQLGISPAPWTKAGDIVDDNEGHVIFNAYEDDDYANARLIAAAPELYKSLAAMLSCAEKEAPFTTESGMSIAMDMARKALKKAAGESEAEK